MKWAARSIQKPVNELIVLMHYIRISSSVTMPTLDALLRYFRKLMLYAWDTWLHTLISYIPLVLYITTINSSVSSGTKVIKVLQVRRVTVSTVHNYTKFMCMPHMSFSTLCSLQHLWGGLPGNKGQPGKNVHHIPTLPILNEKDSILSLIAFHFFLVNTCVVTSWSRSKRWDHSQTTTHSLCSMFL